ncbi:MAG: recombinase family protein [Thermoplasmatota archaeon]
MTDDPPVNKDRAVLYARVSTEDQAKEGYSLAAQEERLRAYCMAKEWRIVKVYIDDGYSGRSDDRPAYKKMMEEMEGWDILVVMKMDRIHRNSKNFTTMMEMLKQNGKEFTSMQESFDTTTAMGRFVMDIIQRIAQLESEQIGERVYVGMMQKAKEGSGHLGFNIPYGFDLDDGEITIVPGEAAAIRTMYEMYLAGGSLSEICQRLEEDGILTKKGLKNWEKKTVSRILSNPMNCGYLHWEGIIYKGEFESIIDPERFNKVQGAMKRGGFFFILNDEKVDRIPA